MRNNVVLVVHYHSKSHHYSDRSVWLWQDGVEGRRYEFEQSDSASAEKSNDANIFRDPQFGRCAVISFERSAFDSGNGSGIPHVHMLVSSTDWSYKSVQYDASYEIQENLTHIWIVEGDSTVYYSRQAALTSQAYEFHDEHAFDMALHSASFDAQWGFSGWLGYHYEPSKTEFRLWAPTAQKVELLLFPHTEAHSSVKTVVPMSRGTVCDTTDHEKNTHGVWFAAVEKNLNGVAYAYRITHNGGHIVTSADPCARAVIYSGERSVVLSEEAMEPQFDREIFENEFSGRAQWRVEHATEAVIAEMHIRDFSISPTSGVPALYRGKFLGASYQGTRNQFGDATTFDYLKSQGYSYVQLQPVADHHKSYLPNGSQRYNWGYDPQNYNVPDSSYSTQPNDPRAAIVEFKEMIRKYHKAGIGVILDVVYNHTFSSKTHPLGLTVPGYFYRMNADGSCANGSGCGNETASEKEMCRKYIIDSVLYWAQEYGVDGFRFDLMGLHDIDTMNEIRRQLDRLDPRIIMYGEGWDMGHSLSRNNAAMTANAARMPRIGFFNDQGRNSVKGAEVYGSLRAGFVSEAGGESVIAKAVLGSDELAPVTAPGQIVNYVEAHDNYNLNDLLSILHPDDTGELHQDRILLANALNLSMQGICFMQLGQEFLRTKLHASLPSGQLSEQDKRRAMNSYNSPDVVNEINWNNVSEYAGLVAFTRELIQLKKCRGIFSFTSFEDIRDHIYVFSAHENSGFIGFDISHRSERYRVVVTTRGIPHEQALSGFAGAHILLSNRKDFSLSSKVLPAFTFVVYSSK